MFTNVRILYAMATIELHSAQKECTCFVINQYFNYLAKLKSLTFSSIYFNILFYITSDIKLLLWFFFLLGQRCIIGYIIRLAEGQYFMFWGYAINAYNI